MSVNSVNQGKDIEELASDFADMMNTVGVASVLAELPTGESAMECEECGADIPEKRRLAIKGVKFCVDCQSILELKNKHRGRGAPVIDYDDE